MDKLDNFLTIVFWTVITVLCTAEFVWMMTINEPFAACVFLFVAIAGVALLVHEYKEKS